MISHVLLWRKCVQKELRRVPTFALKVFLEHFVLISPEWACTANVENIDKTGTTVP